jgi:DNA-binding NarL/FixJ family response regulator
MAVMPTPAHQLQRILADIDRQIAEAEVEILKPHSDQELLALIEKQTGLQLLRKQVDARLKQAEHVKDLIAGLSDREFEVFTLIGGGLTSAAIASHLNIAVSTVETYRERLKDKLELKSAHELSRSAILWAHRRSVNSEPHVEK